MSRGLRISVSTIALAIIGAFAFGLGTSHSIAEPATQPAASGSLSPLEVRAMQAFNARQYAVALPMLNKVASESEMEKTSNDRIGSVRESIRVCEKQIAAAQQAAAAPAVATASDARQKHAKPAEGQVLDIAIKDLGNFDYDGDKGGNIPQDVKDLSGCKVRLHGYMMAFDQAAQINRFAIVPDLFSCCFGQPPQVQHVVIVQCPKGKAVGYYADEIVVEGKLNVEEKKEDGFITSIFDLEVSSVKPSVK